MVWCHISIFLACAYLIQGIFVDKLQQVAPCLSKSCIDASKSLLNNLDLSVDPCENFYRFSCGKFEQQNDFPDNSPVWGSIEQLEEKVLQRGRILLESGPTEEDFESYELIRNHYRSCMNVDKLEELGVQPLLKLLKTLGGWPVLEENNWDGGNFTWWKWYISSNKLGLKLDSILTFSYGMDIENASINVLQIREAALGLPGEIMSQGLENKQVQVYFRFMSESAIVLGASKVQTEQELMKSLEFEIALSKIRLLTKDKQNLNQSYNPVTLKNFPTYKELPPSWLDYYREAFNETMVNFTEDENVIVESFEYLEKLSELLHKTDKRVVANYLGWNAVRQLLPYLNEEARNIHQRFEQSLISAVKKIPKWKICVKEVGFNNHNEWGFKFLAGSMYVRKYVKPKTKESVLELTSYIRDAFEHDILDGLDWMDLQTKEIAKKKVKKMGQFIAYHDEFLQKKTMDNFYKGIRIADDEYFENNFRLKKFWILFYRNQLRAKVNPKSWISRDLVTIVNGFHDQQLNNFYLSAGILQEPFYQPDRPMYLNFGSLGSFIGHEIIHGFDQKGRQFDENGKMRNWWNSTTEMQFFSKAKCMVDQYSNYTSAQVGIPLDGVRTLDENMADNGGVRQSYIAYENWMKDKLEEKPLSGLPYNQKQLFWIGYGQTWCAKYQNEMLRLHIQIGRHSPSEFRVNGPLINNYDFARDFNCALGSNMNPETKCSLW